MKLVCITKQNGQGRLTLCFFVFDGIGCDKGTGGGVEDVGLGCDADFKVDLNGCAVRKHINFEKETSEINLIIIIQ